jgi:hypothetical protein
MRFAISIPQFYADGEFDPAAFRSYFARAEELGFHSAWAQETMLGSKPQFGPVEAMTYAAACTQRLRLGCAVFISTLYSPVHLAKSLSTLDQLSRGRIEIGVGTGGPGRQFAAPLQVSAKSVYRIAREDPTFPVTTIGGAKRIHRDRGEKWLRSLEQGRGKPRRLKLIAQREEETS